MLVDGHPVNPVEWWDPHWIQDRVMRKLAEAAAGSQREKARLPAPSKDACAWHDGPTGTRSLWGNYPGNGRH